MILGISVEQVIDHAATTSRVGREISFTLSSAGRRSAHLPAQSGCPAQVGQLDPLAILIMFAGLPRMRQLRRRHVAEAVIDLGLGLGGEHVRMTATTMLWWTHSFAGSPRPHDDLGRPRWCV
jgi:hypothetical protein